MKPVNITSSGTFGTQVQKIELFLSPRSERLIIFFHGCCGGPYDITPTFYQEIAPKIAEKKIANTAFFQSSRKLQKHLLPAHEINDYETFVTRAFGGKTLQNEIDDANIAIQTIIDKLQENEITYKEIIFVGFSLGGIVSSILSEKFKPKHLYLFGSASQFVVPSYLPIIGQGMKTKNLYKKTNSYRGLVSLIRGTEDNTSSQAAAVQLFESFTNAKEKRYIEWLGVDHRFKQLHGKDTTQIWFQIMNLLMKDLNNNIYEE